MNTRLGISLSRDAVRCVLVQSGRVAWHASESVASNERIGDSLDRLLSNLPNNPSRNARVRVAFGVEYAHIKRIDGLPHVRQPKILDRIVRENVDAFFPRLGPRTLITATEQRTDGTTWAGALDGSLVDEAVATLRKKHRSIDYFAPLAAAAVHALPSGTWCVRDADVGLELTTIEGKGIRACRRISRFELPTAATQTRTPTLIHVGDESEAFLAAYGAAVAPARASFAWKPVPYAGRTRTREMLRIAAAVALLFSAATAAFVARGVHAMWLAGAANAELAGMGDSDRVAARVEADLRRTTAELTRIQQFAAARGRFTTLLGALSETLPDSTALVSLRLDTLEGTFVVLTPRAADVLPPLIDIRELVAPRIVGAVTRENLGGARLERASFRFRRRR